MYELFLKRKLAKKQSRKYCQLGFYIKDEIQWVHSSTNFLEIRLKEALKCCLENWYMYVFGTLKKTWKKILAWRQFVSYAYMTKSVLCIVQLHCFIYLIYKFRVLTGILLSFLRMYINQFPLFLFLILLSTYFCVKQSMCSQIIWSTPVGRSNRWHLSSKVWEIVNILTERLEDCHLTL